MLGELFPKENIVINLESEDKDELFEEMLETLVSAQPQIERTEALAALRLRESKMSTGIMPGVAVPHAISRTVRGAVGAVGISRAGIDYDSLDGSPVHVVFMILFAEGSSEHHLQVMRVFAELLHVPDFERCILSKKTPQEIHDFIISCEAELAG